MSVVTPDREVHHTELKTGGRYSEIMAWGLHLQRLPAGVRQQDCYLARHSPLGRFEADELGRLIEEHSRGRGREPPCRRLPEKTGRSGGATGTVDAQDVGGDPLALAMVAEEKQVALYVLPPEEAMVGDLVAVPAGASLTRQDSAGWCACRHLESSREDPDRADRGRKRGGDAPD